MILPRIVPYLLNDGIPNFRDSEIKGFYDRMVREGTADKVFYDGTVKSADDFLRMMRGRGNALYVVFEQAEPWGFCWLNHFKMKSARIHFCAFRPAWGRAHEYARGSMSQLINLRLADGSYWHDVFCGYTPETNKLAIRMLKQAGMKIVGTIPNKLWIASEKRTVGAVVSYFSRDCINMEQGL